MFPRAKSNSFVIRYPGAAVLHVRIRTYMCSAVCHNSTRRLHFSASNPFGVFLRARFYSGGSAENSRDLRSMKEQEAHITVGKAVGARP